MSRVSRVFGLEKDLTVVDTAFEERLLKALERCEQGVWGLFGQNAHSASSEAEELLDLAKQSHEIRTQLALGENPLVGRFFAYRECRGANMLGEPKLARQFLAELRTPPGAVVTIIVDASFGHLLAKLDQRYPIWIVASAQNDAAVASIKRDNITTFVVRNAEDRQKNLLNVLSDVDSHHGAYSPTSPYRSLLIIGIEAESVLEALAAEGFGNARSTVDGFIVDLVGAH